MNLHLTEYAIAVHCNADHTMRRRNARAHIYITEHGLTYRTD